MCSVIIRLVKAGQAAGELRPMDPTQAFAFCAGALAMPILIGGATFRQRRARRPPSPAIFGEPS